ncbi:MAG: phospholipid/glycerol acyltransferase [Variovorax sp.]|nr:phospholipid/glycerol acyltransferase [Variovorax sp.]
MARRGPLERGGTGGAACQGLGQAASAARPEPGIRSLRALLQLLRAGGHVCAGWWTVRFIFPGLTPVQRDERIRCWSVRMLHLLGVRLRVHGEPPREGPLLLVCNHLSWLDILVLHAAVHARFVAKSGVRHWPMIGALATGAGSLYIERERPRDAMRVVHRMAEALQAAHIVAVFPEGTTGDGRTILPFHANLLQAAISAGAPVRPAALRFADAATGATSFAPRYVGDDHLLGSLWRTLCAKPLVADVRFGDPQPSAGRQRRGWALELRQQVQALRDAEEAGKAEADRGRTSPPASADAH